MGGTVVVISGPVGAGKTTLAKGLERRYGAHVVSSRELLLKRLGPAGKAGRRTLQEAGEALDRETGGQWLTDVLLETPWHREGRPGLLVVDAVRIQPQVDAIHRFLGARVMHVHLTAPVEELATRYAQRRSQAGIDQELASFEEMRANPTESAVPLLANTADLVLDTQRLRPEAVVIHVASQLGLFGRSVDRLVDVLIGGQYGSEGKGHISAHLAREYDVLVRVGGPNAGHKVYEEPAPYTFHLLPSGTRVAPRAQVVLGPGSNLALDCLLKELTECQLQEGRLFIDPQALIIEPEDRSLEEGSLKQEIGSTAQGVGAATARKVLRTAARPHVRLARDVPELTRFLRPTHEVLDDAYARGRKIFLEGTQGTGLSLHHGEFPYVTSRDTTVSGCLAEAGISPNRVRKVLMVCRTYPIRVQHPDTEGGSSGPMVSELSWEEIARRSGLPLNELLQAERTSTTNRQRRISEFDWVLLRKAASLNAPTDVALTFVDYLSEKNRFARRMDQLTEETQRRIEEIERVAGVPVTLVSTRFHPHGIIDRRAW